MIRRHAALVVLLGITLTGCYHATIETGRPTSGQEVRRAWASGWLAGLVPPETLSTAQQCPNGVARVETQLSFLNQIAAGLTFGIYTPMDIRVQCAAAGIVMRDAERIPTGSTALEGREAITRAAQRSLEEGVPVTLVFDR